MARFFDYLSMTYVDHDFGRKKAQPEAPPQLADVTGAALVGFDAEAYRKRMPALYEPLPEPKAGTETIDAWYARMNLGGEWPAWELTPKQEPASAPEKWPLLIIEGDCLQQPEQTTFYTSMATAYQAAMEAYEETRLRAYNALGKLAGESKT